MKIHYNTNGDLVLTDAIKSHCEKNLSKLSKFFDNIISVYVTLTATKSKKGPLQRAEVRVHVNGNTIKGVYTDEDLYTAIDKVSSILEKQLKKHKERLRDDKHIGKKDKKISFENGKISVQTTKKIVNVSFNPRPMDVEEAILQLEALDKDFYVFLNSETGTMNVVYKKRNGDYGHIEPENV